MHACCIYAVCMPAAPPAVTRPPVKQPPAAERVYTHIKQAVLDRRYEGGTLLTEGTWLRPSESPGPRCARHCCGWRSKG